MPEIDTASIKRICEKFARELNYRPEKPITEDNITHRALQKEFVNYSTAAWFNDMCIDSAGMIELVYPGHSEEIRYHFAKFTWLMLYVEDMGYRTPEKLENFQRCIIDGTAGPEDEFFQTLRKHLAQYYCLFEAIPASGIILSIMDFINGCLLEQMPNIQSMKLTSASTSWPYFLRRKTGVSPLFAFMLFPKEVNVDISIYIQVIDDISRFIDLTNDILSFYKEYMAGEQQNYVYNRVAVTQRSIEDTLKDIVEETIQAHSRVAQVLDSSGNTTAVDIWRKFVNGYLGFHFTSKRYRLHELVDVE